MIKVEVSEGSTKVKMEGKITELMAETLCGIKGMFDSLDETGLFEPLKPIVLLEVVKLLTEEKDTETNEVDEAEIQIKPE